MPKRGGLRIHFNYSKFWIDTNGLANMRLKIPFTEGGVVGFKALYKQMLAIIEYNVRKKPNFSEEKHKQLRRQLADAVVEEAIQVMDVLNSFDPDGEPTLGYDGYIHIPLKMGSSTFSVELRFPRCHAGLQSSLVSGEGGEQHGDQRCPRPWSWCRAALAY